MSKKYTSKKIFQLYDDWEKYYAHNNKLGNECIRFAQGEQWDAKVKTTRINRGKETLEFNLAHQHLTRIKSEISAFEFSLDVVPQTEKEPQKVKMANKVLDHILLSHDHTEAFSHALYKSIEFGYGVLHIDAKYENDYTLQLLPYVKSIERVDLAFFDKMALSSTKDDGKFCGLKKYVSLDSIKQSYPKKIWSQWEDKEEEIEIIDFWYKEKIMKTFYQLQNGQWRREDKLKSDDAITENNVIRPVDCVYFVRATEDKILEKHDVYLKNEDNKYFLNKLPLIFIGEVYRHNKGDKEMKECTIPYVVSMMGPQRLYNLIGSQLATVVKDMSARKWLATPAHIEGTERQWEQINQIEGTALYNPDPDNPQSMPNVVPPDRIEPDLMNLFRIAKASIDEIGGVNLSQQGAGEDRAVSGVAVQERIMQGNVLQKSRMKNFAYALNKVGKILKDSLPAMIKNEYQALIDGELIVLNRKTSLDTPAHPDIENSVQSLNEDYDFVIAAAPTSQLEKARAANALMQVITQLPQLTPYMIDVLIKNIDIIDSVELQRRFKAMIPPEIYQLGEGEMDLNQYYQFMTQKAQQQQQAQSQQPDPMMADVQMRDQKNKMDAQLKGKELQLKAKEIQDKEKMHSDKMKVERAKVKISAHSSARDTALKAQAMRFKKVV